MKRLFLISFGLLMLLRGYSQTGTVLEHHKWALTPPMGWNSWDCFGPSVVEGEVKANADYMAANLLAYGWEYIVVDIRWYVDNQTTGHYNAFDKSAFVYDEFGRYTPSLTRFPSATNGAGFKPLADYVHAKGLKFGIHIMRGVPKVAVNNKLPIKGTNKTAADIYSTAYECTWLQDNYTVDATKPGAQEYYNSIVDLYASWGVDYIKVDDLSRPYHDKEIEMLRNAIDQTGRPIVLSMSPGATPLDQHEHANRHANLWRTIDDFWDNWSQLNYSFAKCANWAPYIAPGAWPDADMLPLGHLSIRGERGADRMSNFTRPEQYTLMSLWSIFKSPLMFGGHLPDNDTFTNALITNSEVLNMHKISVDNKQWFNNDGAIGWTANDPANGDKFVALFNNSGDGFVDAKNLLYRSGNVTILTDGYGEHINVNIPQGSNELYLIVADGGDGNAWDHANWIDPTIYLSNGDSVKLADKDWVYASAGWGIAQHNASVSGGKLSVKGIEYPKGIGTHAQSAIFFQIPENTVRFKAFGGLDKVATDENRRPTVEFMVSVVDPTLRKVNMAKVLANSGRVSRAYQSQGVSLTANIANAKTLYLVVTDAGDNIANDHADWINPAIYKPNGDSLLLTTLNWRSATSGWGQVKKNTSLSNNPLTVNGTAYANGLGVNSYSIVAFDLPQGYTTFKTFCGFDDEVKNAESGVTMEFLVFTEDPAVLESTDIAIDLEALGFTGECTIRDLWAKSDLGTYTGAQFVRPIVNHGAGLYRIAATRRSTNVAVALSSKTHKVAANDTLALELNLTPTNGDTEPLTGWVQLYQNDSLIGNIPVGAQGSCTHKLVCATAGKHVFKAHFGGNAHYAPVNAEAITVKAHKSSKKK